MALRKESARCYASRTPDRASPEDIRPLLFAPFFTTKRDGRGLGLTLTREILAWHGFDVGLENRAEGGAELWVGF